MIVATSKRIGINLHLKCRLNSVVFVFKRKKHDYISIKKNNMHKYICVIENSQRRHSDQCVRLNHIELVRYKQNVNEQKAEPEIVNILCII